MERNKYIAKIPTWALCYIINGDPTGLENKDIKLIDNYLYDNNVEIVSPLTNKIGDLDPYFSHYPEWGLAAEVVDCTIICRV